MKYTFIGDIHGKVEQVERALAKDGKKVFVGDFIDSFDRTPEEHSKCYDLVLDAIERGEAQAIHGNHELSYLMSNPHQCSGFDPLRAHVVGRHRERIEKLFVPYVLISPEFLVTHAGLTKQVWDREKLTVATLPQRLNAGWTDMHSFVHAIGYARGGRDEQGGIFWCDFQHEFKPVPGLTQVFGHTRVPGVQQIEQSFAIDCLDRRHDFLEMELDDQPLKEAA